MRGAPQVGFSATIRKISSCTSLGVCRRPKAVLVLEITFQYKRKPARCHRTTVSGVTIMRDCFHLGQNRFAKTRQTLSKTVSLGRDACASVLRDVDGERDFREARYDECGTAEGSLRIRVQRYLSCPVATAFHLWSATPYPVEITGGQSFGEAQDNNCGCVNWCLLKQLR